MRNRSWLFLVLVILTSCFSGNDRAAEQDPLPSMVFPGETWAVRSPEMLGMDSGLMVAALDTLEKYCGDDGVEEVVITRNGYIVHRGDSAAKVHGVWSTTKSFTSTVLGLLRDRGIASEQDRAAGVYPELSALYGQVTLKHFATHTSGYDAVGCNRWCRCCDDDWSPTMLDIGRPLFEPGTRFLYYDEAMEMFAQVLTMVLGEPMEDFIRRELLNTIGIGSFHWHAEYTTPGGIPVCRGGSDIRISALDLARFGHLYLNRGNWDGAQLLSEQWVREATTNQVPGDIAHKQEHRPGTDGRGVYGYNFWINGTTPGGTRLMPDAPVDIFFTSGFNNNMCFVVPRWNMVVVRMGLDGNPPEGKADVYNIFFRELGKAIRGLPSDESIAESIDD